MWPRRQPIDDGYIRPTASAAPPDSLPAVPKLTSDSRTPTAGVERAASLTRRPVAIDLFAGAGGLSLGFEQAGFDVLAAVEYDPVHAAAHAYNFPMTEVVCADLADTTSVNADRLREAANAGWAAHSRTAKWDGVLDVVIGGPPCQGFSFMGKRRVEDVRNQLVFRFAELVGELKPRHFVMENVPGMSSLAIGPGDNAQPLLDSLLVRFRELGYELQEPKVLNATSFGVPQDRRRLILLGTRRGESAAGYPKPQTIPRPKRPGTDGDPAFAGVLSARCPTVWDAIGDLPDLDTFEGLRYTDEARLPDHQLVDMRGSMSSYARVLHGLAHDPDDLSWPREWDSDLLTSSCRTAHKPDVVARFDATSCGHAEPVSRLFRLDPNGVCCTLRAGTHYERGSFNAPRPIHPKLPRVLSVREAARLHSLPDWFRLHWTKWHGFRQVGNALPPLVGRAVGNEIVRALALTPARPITRVVLGDSALLMMENIRAAEHFGADQARMPRNALRYRTKKLARAAP